MRKRALIYVILSGILWGSSAIFFTLLKRLGFTSLQMTAVRSVGAALYMGLFTLVCDRSAFRISGKELPFYLISGLMMYGAAAFYYGSIAASSPAVAAVLMYTSPAFVMVWSVLFLKETLTRRKVLSVALVIAGCALVSGIGGGGAVSLAGILLGLAAGLSYGTYTIVTKLEMKRRLSSVSANLYSLLIMGLVSIPLGDPSGIVRNTAENLPAALPLMLGVGLFTCVLPYVFFSLSLRELPAGTAASLSVIEPLAAALFSVCFFGERLSAATVCGIVLILTAVFLLSGKDPVEE